MIKDEQKHHKKCRFNIGDICNCSEIYTPPTIPRYQRQLMKKADERRNKLDPLWEEAKNSTKLSQTK